MRTTLLPWLLFATVSLVYLPSIRNGFVYDDEVLIVKAARPERVADFWRVFGERHFPTVPYYRPITRLTFMAQKGLHDLDPRPYHLFNAVLAGLAVLTAYRLLCHPAFGIPRAAAATAALAWAVHPAMSSCVHPICSGRETLLPSVLILLAVDAWIRPGRRHAAGALLFSAAALFAREQAIVLPLLFAVADGLDLSGEARFAGWPRFRAMALGRYLVWLGLGLGYLAIRHALFGGAEFTVAVRDAPWMPAYSYLYGLQTVWLPFIDLVYEPPVTVWWSGWRLGTVLTLTAILLSLVWRRGRRRHLVFWCAWFILLQAPTANLLKQEAPFDERYVMLAALAVPALAATLYGAWIPRRRAGRAAITVAAAAIILSAAGISGYRGRFFADDATFNRQWIRTNPWSVDALVNDSKYRIDAGDYERAEWAASRAVRLAPELANAWYNHGLAQYHLGAVDTAIASYRRTLELDPGYAAHYNLALALSDVGQTESALTHYRAALTAQPDHGDALYNLGLLLARGERYEEAIAQFALAAALAPDDAEPLYNQGVAFERLDQPETAATRYRQTLERNPGHTGALFNLGTLHFREGRYDEAVEWYTRLVTVDPGDRQAQRNLRAAREAMANRH